VTACAAAGAIDHDTDDSFEKPQAAVSFFRRCADAGGMIALALGILACVFGIIALLPDAEGFSDE